MDKSKKPLGPPPGGQPPMGYPGIPGMPPGMMPPNSGGRPMVVVMMKGGGQPNLNGLPFMMGGPPPPGGKKKKKSKGGKKKTKKSGAKKTKKSGEEESDSDSDRVNAPDIPTAHTHKGPPGSNPTSPNVAGGGGPGGNGPASSGRGGPGGPNKNKPGTPANPMASSFGSNHDGGGAPPSTTSTTSTTSAAGGAPGAAGAAKKTPAKKTPVKKAPAKPGVKKENFIIKDGNVDKSCVPAFVLVEGPAGCPIAVPVDARDESAVVNELGPQPLTVAPKETTRGYLIINEDGLLYFKHHKECKEAPFASTPGQLVKFLTNSNIFISDNGPQLPDEKAWNKASKVTKDKIGVDIAVSGHVTMVTDKGTCKFTRVAITQQFPFYPHTAAFGVLVRDFSNGYVFFVPTENRFVGMVLSQGIKQPFKPVVEAQIVGNIYKDAHGAPIWEVPSDKKDNLMGYIMSSATGVPIYVNKPDDTIQRAAAPIKKAAASKMMAVTPSATSVTGQTASPSPASPSTTAAAAGGAAPAADGTASTTVPIAGQPGDAGGAAKPVESVTCINPATGGGGGVTSMTVPIAAPSDPPAATAAEGGTGAAAVEEKKEESPQDQLKKLVASQAELPPVPEQPAEAPAKEEEKQEEKEEPPPPPPKPALVSTTNQEYKKFLDDRSTFL